MYMYMYCIDTSTIAWECMIPISISIDTWHQIARIHSARKMKNDALDSPS